jgi:hypothetical protein
MNHSQNGGAQGIGKKSFSAEDQTLFAAISLDVNPLHMDPLAARRLMTGKQAVHGVHILLVALELWRNEQNARPTSLRCNFANLIGVGDDVVFSQAVRNASSTIIEARVNGLLCVIITIGTGMATPSNLGSAQYAPAQEVAIVEPLSSPLEEPPEAHLGRTYAIKVREEDYSTRFPLSYRYFGGKTFAAICSLSYLVGMVCPGLHSIFTSLDVTLRDGAPGDQLLRFRCENYDERYGLFRIGVQGCIEGHVKAFLRGAPPTGPSVTELADFVQSAEFAGTTTLIIGGSRGLGAATARILAAGGGDVVITYAAGFQQAREVSDEINLLRKNACRIVKFDLKDDSFESMNIDFSAVHSVYYFATPRILTRKAGVFDPKIFQAFYLYYVGRFYDLCAHLEEVAGKPLQVFFPSSVYVEDRPHDVTEYAMAKSAAEILIADLNKYLKYVSISTARLPRLNTDQNTTIFKNVSANSNVDILLPIVRSLNAVAAKQHRVD